jgi:hypothetical protein
LSLSSKNAKFRVNTKGAVISKTKPKGTTIKFSTSEDAKLTFSITRSVKSSKTKKTTYKIVKSFSRSAKAGDNSFSFSGRYRDAKGKKRALAPGKYKLTATPTDAAGNVGLPRSISFTITS